MASWGSDTASIACWAAVVSTLLAFLCGVFVCISEFQLFRLQTAIARRERRRSCLCASFADTTLPTYPELSRVDTPHPTPGNVTERSALYV